MIGFPSVGERRPPRRTVARDEAPSRISERPRNDGALPLYVGSAEVRAKGNKRIRLKNIGLFLPATLAVLLPTAALPGEGVAQQGGGSAQQKDAGVH